MQQNIVSPNTQNIVQEGNDPLNDTIEAPGHTFHQPSHPVITANPNWYDEDVELFPDREQSVSE